MKPIFANNAASLLAVPLTASDLSIQLTAGYGVLFPNPDVNEYFSVTLENQQATLREIIKIGSKTGDTLHVIARGSQNTVPQNWTTSPPTLVDHRVTANDMNILYNTVTNSQIVREVPTGDVDGINKDFTLAFAPMSGSESVFLNGLLQDPGLDDDYMIFGAVISFVVAPQMSDKIRATYTATAS